MGKVATPKTTWRSIQARNAIIEYSIIRKFPSVR